MHGEALDWNTQTPAIHLPAEANNLTALRLLLASLVLLFHFCLLSGKHPQVWPCVYPDFAVDGFFVVSGFLIFAAFDRNPDAKRFSIRRFFRLYPLYILIVTVQTTLLIKLQPDGARPHLLEAGKYFIANAVFLNFLQNHIGHVLDGLFDPGINPSLWTLKVEVAFYVLTPLIWLVCKRCGAAWLLYVFFASALYTAVLRHFGKVNLSRELPGAMQYFIVGIFLYTYRSRIDIRSWILVPLTSFSMVAVTMMQMGIEPLHNDHWRILFPALVGVIVFALAFRAPILHLKSDLSYGIYLIHGPTIQMFAFLGLLSFSMTCFLTVVALVTCLAFVAFYVVEKPCIDLGHSLSAR